MKTLLLASNSFKECADSVKAVELFQSNLLSLKNVNIIVKPISDGGDGFLEVCKYYFELQRLNYGKLKFYKDVFINGNAGYDQKNRIMYLEASDFVGLKNLTGKTKQPVYFTSESLGKMLKLVLDDYQNKKLKIRKLIIGIGGTATNDFGLGVCSAFGLNLFDKQNHRLNVSPINYNKVVKIGFNKITLPFEIELIVDVGNPLIGENGAAKTFAKQKGASKEDMQLLESGTENILNIMKDTGLISEDIFLSGAGGGLAAGLQIFFNAKIIKSDKFILNHLKLNEWINKTDYVLTGEGSFDSQSFMNKATGTILKSFQNSAEKIFLCCGTIEKISKNRLADNIYPIELAQYFKTKEESIRNFKKGIELACEEIIKNL
jgi:glycerate kinase